MILLFHADSRPLQGKISVKQLLKVLPESLWEKAERYKFDQDAYNYILGRLMLKHGLIKLGLAKELLEAIQYNERDKPLLEDVYFNISHSQYRTVCAISLTHQIGLDIEVYKDIYLPDFKTWFLPEEWDAITSAKKPIDSFYNYWTRKESILKADGTGMAKLMDIRLSSNLNVANIQGSDQTWFLNKIELDPDCALCICTNKSRVQVKFNPFTI